MSSTAAAASESSDTMKKVIPDTTRPILFPCLQMIFQDLNPALYPCIRFIPNELIEIITDYATDSSDLRRVTFIRMAAVNPEEEEFEALQYRSTICSNEDEIRLRCLNLMNEKIFERGVTSTGFQDEVARWYDSAMKQGDDSSSILQEEVTHLSPELVFQSTAQKSAYLVYAAYKRFCLSGLPPECFLRSDQDEEPEEAPEGAELRYNQLVIYATILFGDIDEAIRGVQYIRSMKQSDQIPWGSVRIRKALGFMTIVSEIDPLTGRPEMYDINGKKLHEEKLLTILPNPFTPNLSYPHFFNKLIQQEKNGTIPSESVKPITFRWD